MAVRGSRRHWDSPERGFPRRLPSPPVYSPGTRACGAGSTGRGGQRRQDERGTGVVLSARARVCAESTLPTTAQLSLRSLPRGRMNGSLSLEDADSWLGGSEKSPSSEPKSENASSSTQFSETGSQVSAGSGSARLNGAKGSATRGWPRARTFSSHTTSTDPRRGIRVRSRRATRSKVEGPRSRSTSARSIWDDDS